VSWWHLAGHVHACVEPVCITTAATAYWTACLSALPQAPPRCMLPCMPRAPKGACTRRPAPPLTHHLCVDTQVLA
jgi:hypothetical protein